MAVSFNGLERVAAMTPKAQHKSNASEVSFDHLVENIDHGQVTDKLAQVLACVSPW